MHDYTQEKVQWGQRAEYSSTRLEFMDQEWSPVKRYSLTCMTGPHSKVAQPKGLEPEPEENWVRANQDKDLLPSVWQADKCLGACRDPATQDLAILARANVVKFHTEISPQGPLRSL